MIIAEEFFAIKCDVCDEIAEDHSGMSYWDSIAGSQETASELGWSINDLGTKKHYCPKCFDYDSDGNVILISKKDKKPDQVFYQLTSDYVLYFNSKAEILKIGDVFKLAGLKLSSHGNNSPFFYKDDIVRLPNGILKEVFSTEHL